MFNDWKQAWRQAVENFNREAGGGIAGSGPHVRAMERELTSVNGTLLKLDDEIRRTRRDLEHERGEESACHRREALARGVGDDETARVAAEFAQRHAERGAILDRKIAVLEDERALVARDVEHMRKALAEVAPAAGIGDSARNATTAANTSRSANEPRPEDPDFRRMEREARERAATERLEELKRRMQK